MKFIGSNLNKSRSVTIIILALLLLNIGNVAGMALEQELPVYIVQEGDSLNTIALRFGISPEDIQTANNIADPNTLMIGQRLSIPGLEGVTGILTSQVMPFGATLTSLTRQYALQQTQITALNKITSPSEVIAGVKLIIPVNEAQPDQGTASLMISGGTLLETAIRNDTSPWRVMSENQLDGSWDLLPGELIFTESKEEGADNITTALPNISEVSFNTLPVVQGETFVITINADNPVNLTGSFADTELQFFSENNQDYHSFHGIHALTEPGPYPLEITLTSPDGTLSSFTQLVLIVAGGYGNEWVNVPEDYLDETQIAEEDTFLQPILSQRSPEKQWEGQFRYPVDEPCLNSRFGQRRDYNNGGLYFYHTGMDFIVCTASNINVYAPAAGKVVVAEELFVKGNAVIIDHGWGVFTGYWHLSEINIKVGDSVQPGDIIGLIGNTGRSAGSHLHFEIGIAGTPVNPETWLTREFP